MQNTKVEAEVRSRKGSRHSCAGSYFFSMGALKLTFEAIESRLIH